MIMKRAAEESGRGNRPNNNHGALADLLTPEQQALLRLGAGGDLAQLLQQSNLSSILAQQQQMGMGSFNNTLAFLQQHQRDQLLAEQLRGGLLGQSSLEALRMNQQLMGSSNAGLAGAAALKTSGEDAEKVSELPADDMDAKDGEGDEDDNDNEDEKDADTFPFKLYRMIAEAEKNGQDDIISFNAKGRCFLIHQPREFVLEIMPKYFTTSRMSSFQRQLNLYGFRRISESGPDKGGYVHPSFIKGKRSLCKKIKRKKPSIKLPPPGLSYMNPSLMAAPNPSLSVRQMIADGHLSEAAVLSSQQAWQQQQLLGGLSATNPTLAAALLLERQQHPSQADLLQQLILRQQQERELFLLEQRRQQDRS